jgi:hypothetical protein
MTTQASLWLQLPVAAFKSHNEVSAAPLRARCEHAVVACYPALQGCGSTALLLHYGSMHAVDSTQRGGVCVHRHVLHGFGPIAVQAA